LLLAYFFFSFFLFCSHLAGREREERKKKKNYASSKKLLTSIKEKGPLGKKSPFTRKEESSQCGSGGLRADKPADLSCLVLR